MLFFFTIKKKKKCPSIGPGLTARIGHYRTRLTGLYRTFEKIKKKVLMTKAFVQSHHSKKRCGGSSYTKMLESDTTYIDLPLLLSRQLSNGDVILTFNTSAMRKSPFCCIFYLILPLSPCQRVRFRCGLFI